MEIQQSTYYASYIRSLGWIVHKLDGSYIFIKPFPFIGGLAKIQRVNRLPSIHSLLPILRTYHIRTLAIEPDSSVSQKVFTNWCHRASRHIRLNKDSFIPTKTIRVKLMLPEHDLFSRLSEAKRRAVRRAQKNGVTVIASDDIDTLIRLKNRSAGFLGFITTAGVRNLWNILPQKNRKVLLALDRDKNPIAGILLLFWSRVAYYWIAGALPQGKKMFAPTLLVWEALKQSKLHNCTSLDFIGVWDDRHPDKNHEWKGFTKFKEGFGGEILYYPIVP